MPRWLVNWADELKPDLLMPNSNGGDQSIVLIPKGSQPLAGGVRGEATRPPDWCIGETVKITLRIDAQDPSPQALLDLLAVFLERYFATEFAIRPQQRVGFHFDVERQFRLLRLKRW